MSEEKSKRSPRKRVARGKLRKGQEIDRVLVEEPFQLRLPDGVDAQATTGQTSTDRRTGEGAYISATFNNRRYYGVLVDQPSLRAASMLYFQDEASGLELNRKMEYLIGQRQQQREGGNNKRPNPVDDDDQDGSSKRQKLDVQPDVATSGTKKKSAAPAAPPSLLGKTSAVQKFRYVEASSRDGDEDKKPASTTSAYRILLATYADVDAAAEDDLERSRLIESACESGGNFVGNYYYQYEVKSSTLQASGTSKVDQASALRMSMGFQSFLHNTLLPDWFPLSNLHGGQQKLLSMLNMKKDKHGNAVWDENAKPYHVSLVSRKELIPMEPRTRYRVCVVGGGIAGLSCCAELFRICDREEIDIEVVLLEGRSRLGGRLWTDCATFKASDGTAFPVDLGASWIHGINQNPLAALAREASIDFVTTSEEVKMYQGKMKELDQEKDERAGKFFDELLDHAANDVWVENDRKQASRQAQSAVRWYASGLGRSSDKAKNEAPRATAPPTHRRSSDITVDCSVGRVIAKHKLSEFALLSEEERRMLTWNQKNIEYALGANLKDLSMKFWDIDERHAFDGDHVLLKQGYSSVVDHLHRSLRRRGERFKCMTDFAVGKLEYNRKSTTQPYTTGRHRSRKLVDLSDSCCVTSHEGSRSVKCDYVVSAVPLGVLKASLCNESSTSSVKFIPVLPHFKRDAIREVGFGLLNKVYLQFPLAFWRGDDLLGKEYTQFGNASAINPHHYMFLDVGKALGPDEDPAAILMCLISGQEAAENEKKTEKTVVSEVLETLRFLFSKVTVPDPVEFKATFWGSDRFSRGSYTFLPPGTTDQDFEALQSPVNGNGDSLLLEGSETMRLFFAGEHTTALHPSMAHGAMMSGVRAAKEVVDAMDVSLSIEEYDHLVPITVFRFMHPNREVCCCMCQNFGSTSTEGNLLAFKKGARQILCHNNCAEYSPEVEVSEGKWKNVFVAVNRSRNFSCVLCGQLGASIGCAHSNCKRCYHFSCAEDIGWRFDIDGKEFFCDLHQSICRDQDSRVSLKFFHSKVSRPGVSTCALCGESETNELLGEPLAFLRFSKTPGRMVVVHEKCIKYTSIVDVGEDSMSRIDKEYRNVFNAIDLAKKCDLCGKNGATIRCRKSSCGICYHFHCARRLHSDFEKDYATFRCKAHRKQKAGMAESAPEGLTIKQSFSRGPSLFSMNDQANNPDVIDISDDESEGFQQLMENLRAEEEDEEEDEFTRVPSDISLAVTYLNTSVDGVRQGVLRLTRIFRKSVDDSWNVDFYVTTMEGSTDRVLTIASSTKDPIDPIKKGDIVRAMNGVQVGSSELSTLGRVFDFLSREVEVMLEVRRLRNLAGF